jgi:hypothetical protein
MEKQSPFPKGKAELHLGHVDSWEVAWYGKNDDVRSVVVECVRCGVVLAEIYNADE